MSTGANAVEVFLGIDGGSTSTKAVCLSRSGDVLASAYRLSQGDPVADAIAVLQLLRQHFAQNNTRMEILGSATTGYSRDLLQRVFHADAALVETVAHANSALRIHPDVDAIIDVGGQDIKIICLNHGAVKDFRLNTQCSAGNGYFLQAAAESLGIAIEDFADVAFTAQQMPVFSYGCAVFLQSDIVNFQRQGWQPQEIIAGLAAVLPKNVFLYVAGVSNIATLGRRFLLQGGTQRNLAVVKAEVDFMRSHFFDEAEPEIFVHPHCGEAGAIGAALHMLEQYAQGRRSSFIGMDALDQIRYTTVRNEETRCGFCSNRCARTFIEVNDGAGASLSNSGNGSAPDSPDGSARRIILANCERGEASDAAGRATVQRLARRRQEAEPQHSRTWRHEPHFSRRWFPASPRLRAAWPCFPPRAAAPNSANSARRCASESPRSSISTPTGRCFPPTSPASACPRKTSSSPTPPPWSSSAARWAWPRLIPASLPRSASRTSTTCWIKARAGSCDFIFFPMIDILTTMIEDCRGSNACPAGAATPEAVQSAFSLSRNLFEEHNITYMHPVVNLADLELLALQMFECWKDVLGLDWQENTRAIDAAYDAQQRYEKELRQAIPPAAGQTGAGTARSAWFCSGRPYHHDPGLNQGILDSLQQLGYPIFSQTYLPLDEDLLERLFGAEVSQGLVTFPALGERCLEGLQFGRNQPQTLGRQVRRPPSQPDSGRTVELQVRPRRLHQPGHRTDHRVRRKTPLLLPRYRREQTRGRAAHPRGNHRLLPEAVPQAAGGRELSEQRPPAGV